MDKIGTLFPSWLGSSAGTAADRYPKVASSNPGQVNVGLHVYPLLRKLKINKFAIEFHRFNNPSRQSVCGVQSSFVW